MNEQNDEFDPRLEALFRSEHTHLPAEPFSTSTLRAVAAARRRAVLTTRLLQVAGLIALIVLSPQLIAASIWFSTRLDEAFELVSVWLTTPYGMAAAAVAAFAVWWARRRVRHGAGRVP
jgi:hypothetical protein